MRIAISIFCTAFEEIRQFSHENHTRAKRRNIIAARIYGFNELFAIAA